MQVPFRAIAMKPPEVEVSGHGGVLYLRHPKKLRVLDADLLAMLERCCDQYAHKTFLAERDGAGWRSITFAEFLNSVQRVAAALERRGAVRGDRIGLLAQNSIDHAIANFATLALGAVVVPLSPAYLAHPQGAQALSQLAAAAEVSMLIHDDALAVQGLGIGRCVPLSLIAERAHGDVIAPPLASRRETIQPSDTAKIFFTSGSTGAPKPVRLTHRMLVSAAAMLDQVAAQLPNGHSGVTVDWLPWSHTFGGNVNVHAALMRGKALHIDAGAPLPGRFEKTLENLADVGPTEFSSVPAAYPLLLQALEQNETFARRFFSRVRMCSFGGAALSPSLVARLQAVSIRVCGERIAFGGGYGMTEACGLLALVYWRTDRTDLLGLPPPGVEMKLIRIDGDRWECRVRGENIFAGYGDTARAEVFDDEGFFITGDAVQFAEPGEPDEGLLFAGRIKEDFKLANGTWVRAGGLREALLDKLRPLASDLIVVGENREELAALVWSPHRDEASLQALWQLCREFNAQRPGATQRIARLSLCERPADPAAGELTAKGTINVRKLLDNRRELVEQVYSSDRYRV
jgi:feruloyl-CoA synthase